jgi:Uma2 family endonuclease
MSAKPEPKRMTVAEYLAHERVAEYKSDFIDGRLYPVHDPFGPPDAAAMAGASREHNRVKDNLVGELYAQLRTCGCQSFSSDQRVRVSPTGRFNYPDIVIVCDPPRYAADDRDALVNAQVVIEILSPSTESYDRGLKFAGYRRQPSIREVVFVAQAEPRVERFVRQPDGTWVLTVFDDPAGEITLASVPVRVLLADVYRGVDLPPNVPPPEIESGVE